MYIIIIIIIILNTELKLFLQSSLSITSEKHFASWERQLLVRYLIAHQHLIPNCHFKTEEANR